MITTGLISLIGSTIITAVLKLMAMRMENTRLLEEAKLQALNAKAKVTDQARRYSDKGFQITRRVIAIGVVYSAYVLPLTISLLMPFFVTGEVLDSSAAHINFCYDQVVSGFWPFTDSTTKTICQQLTGTTITADHWNIMNAIIGMYFGDRITRK